MRALQKTSSIEQDQARILPVAFDEIAATRPDALAVIDEYENLSFANSPNAQTAIPAGRSRMELQKGDVVALLMGNRADYAAIWLGLTRVGVVVALLNKHCRGAGAGALPARRQGWPRHRGRPAFRACGAAAELVGDALNVISFDGASERGAASSRNAKGSPASLCGMEDSRDVTLKDRALYIFTSGTTGLPKAAIVTHRRVMSWSLWFSGLTDAGPQDRMYNCLPMYHSVGGVVAIWSALLAGGSVVLRARFSASGFWKDVADASMHDVSIYRRALSLSAECAGLR